MCEVKLDKESHGKCMPIRMHRTLFPLTNIDELNISINKIYVLHAYKDSCIPQMGIYHIAILKKGIENGCSLFVVPGNSPTLLKMPDCKRLNLLTVNCQPSDNANRKRQINKQTKQCKL